MRLFILAIFYTHIGLVDNFSEICTDNERNTRRLNNNRMFSNGYGFPGIVAKHCEVSLSKLAGFQWQSIVHSETSKKLHAVMIDFLIYCYRLLSPLSVVPFVTFTGLGLYHLGFPLVRSCNHFTFSSSSCWKVKSMALRLSFLLVAGKVC